MKLAILAAVLLQWGTPNGGNPWSIIPPPARYVHPYTGKLTVLYGTAQQVYQWCFERGGYDARACAEVGPGVCTVMLPNEGDPQILALLRRHEMAHCNGWPANHPQ